MLTSDPLDPSETRARRRSAARPPMAPPTGAGGRAPSHMPLGDSRRGRGRKTEGGGRRGRSDGQSRSDSRIARTRTYLAAHARGYFCAKPVQHFNRRSGGKMRLTENPAGGATVFIGAGVMRKAKPLAIASPRGKEGGTLLPC